MVGVRGENEGGIDGNGSGMRSGCRNNHLA